MQSLNFLHRTCGIASFAPRVGLASMSSGPKKSLPPSSSYDGVVCDMDGVLWRGQEVISRSIDALNVLKLRGKSIVFVTNNSSKTRIAIAKRLIALGYDAEASDIITSSSVAADYLHEQLHVNKNTPDGGSVNKGPIKVFMIGNPALQEELEKKCFQVLSVPHDAPAILDEEEMTELQGTMDHEVKAVVVGVDYSFNYRKLSVGGLYLQNRQRLYVATNPDNANRISSGGMHPETGSLISALEALTGMKPTICGKPSRIVVDQVLNYLQAKDPHRLLMVGDRLDTDIAFANSAKFSSCLVLSGVTSEDEVQHQISHPFDNCRTPEFLAWDLWDMISPVSAEHMKMLEEKRIVSSMSSKSL